MFDFMWVNVESLCGYSFVCAAMFGVLMLLGLLGSVVWQWMDDADTTPRNQLFRLVMRVYGWEHARYNHTNYLWYKYKKNSDEWKEGTDDISWCVIFTVLFFFSIPAQLYLLTTFPWVGFIGATFVALAFLGRFAIRTSKKFKGHVANVNAHTEGNLT